MHGLLALATLLAGFITAAVLIAAAGRRAIAGARDAAEPAAPGRDVVAASLLHAILVRGGLDASDARARIGDHVAAEPVDEIDVGSWAERYAAVSSAEERSRLLELAVQLAVEREGPIPLAQYDRLLDLSFGLGFQTDALARLRARYGFAYVDHAKAGRPQSAGRRSRTTFFSRTSERAALLSTLGLSEPATRRDVISAYRKLALQCHPDHLAGASDDEKLEAVQRFIDVTAAYETLLRLPEAD